MPRAGARDAKRQAMASCATSRRARKPTRIMNDKLLMLRTIGNRLAIALAVMVGVMIPGAFYAHLHPDAFVGVTPLAALMAGMIGGFVGLQRRLKSMPDDDLVLLANSWVHVCLSPLVGGILAVVTYILFVSGLLAGDLFPTFVPDAMNAAGADALRERPVPGAPHGFGKIFAIQGAAAADYAKMLFWCFLAGFSERFAPDIMSRFESRTGEGGHAGR
jgi:hypothetical protein